jgi:HEAT repeat protein
VSVAVDPHTGIKEESPMSRTSQLVAHLAAAAALGELGSKAKAAVPVLVRALKDPHVHIRKLAALALGDIGPDAKLAVPALSEALNDKHADVRRRAAVALGEIGGGAPALRQAMQDADEGVRTAAGAALKGMRRRKAA